MSTKISAETLQALKNVQSKLNAPKNQFNKFGGYNYRSAEDILEAVKPLLAGQNASIIISDDIVQVADRIYVKAIATFIAGGGRISTTAFAREEETKKGMDSSQITGSASSYARKYALNGLLLIDDNKDADATNTHDKQSPKAVQPEKKKELSLEDRRLGVIKKFQNNYDKLAQIFLTMGLIDAGEISQSELIEIVGKLDHNQIDNIKIYM